MNARVVSLVPSVTETLLALGIRPVACTRFCEQPGLSTVGGTKDPDLAAIIGLAPDLVVVNDEENRRDDADALADAGLTVHSMSPRSIADVGPAVDALAAVLGVASLDLPLPLPAATRGAAVTFVWRRPWMTQRRDTYGSSVLERLGWSNPIIGGDERYPTVELDAMFSREPVVVVLPSEPYPFSERHRPEIEQAMPGTAVVLVDGRDLFWWGVRTPRALDRLAEEFGDFDRG